MFDALAYLPGRTLASAPLLTRYLPSIPAETTQTWLKEHCAPGSWVLDPFGTSPRHIFEIAQAGFRVLTTINNPIDRFVLELLLSPPQEEELRASLADLASSLKGEERLEPHLRALYFTHCTECGAETEAHYFIWDKATYLPILKFISCPSCSATGERPTTSFDRNKALQFTATSPYVYRALERVAPLHDPDRPYVQEALHTYLPRAIYALMTIINKLESFSLERQRLLSAMLLYVFDEANALWTYPATRGRPKQLVVPAKFREKNVWFALEEAVEMLGNFSLHQDKEHGIELNYWPSMPSSRQGICLFKGRLRDLVNQIKASSSPAPHISAVVTTFPRPNQVYWTLSALWSGWLWGREASLPMKRAIRRRRFGKSWYATALNRVLKYMGALCEKNTPYYCLMQELDSGYISAALIAANKTPLIIEGLAFHPLRKIATFQFTQGRRTVASPSSDEISEQDLRELVYSAIEQYIQKLGEPAYYAQVHLASLLALIHSPLGAQYLNVFPSRAWHQVNMLIKNTLLHYLDKNLVSRKDKPLENSLWWLTKPTQTEVPLSDRIEKETFALLLDREKIDTHTLDALICQKFRGLFTPSQEVIIQCLESYAEHDADDPELWKIIPSNRAENRIQDENELNNVIVQLGERLGFKVISNLSTPILEKYQPILWLQPQEDHARYVFFITTSAALYERIVAWEQYCLTSSQPRVSPNLLKIFVIPGSRAKLILYKLSSNFALEAHLRSGWKFLKFRHLRGLMKDTSLTPQRFEELLEQDPLSNIDPQLQLL